MEQTKKKSGFSRLKEYAAPYKESYILSVILAILGVASNMIHYFSVSKVLVKLIQGGEFPQYLMWYRRIIYLINQF